MSVRDEIVELLVGRAPIRCLPAFWREFVHHVLPSVRDDVLAEYRDDRLRQIQQFIEPLAIESCNEHVVEFRQLCETLRSASAPSKVAKAIGAEMGEAFSPMSWLHWADPIERGAVECLYCIACMWALPVPRDTLPEDDAWYCTLAADSLLELRRPSMAVGLLESWLGLARDAYEHDDLLAAIVGDNMSSRMDDEHRCRAVLSLAEALSRDADRGKREAFALLQTYIGITSDRSSDRNRIDQALAAPSCPLSRIEAKSLRRLLLLLTDLAAALPGTKHSVLFLVELLVGLETDDYEKAPQLVAAIEESSIGGLTSDDNVRLWANVGGLVGKSQGRGHARAAMLLESLAGIERSDYGDSETLDVRLRSSPLEKAALRSKVLYLSKLGDSLARTSLDDCQRSAYLLELLCGFDATTYSNIESAQTAWRKSPAGRGELDLQVHIAMGLGMSLCVTPDRGPEAALTIMESFLGTSRDAFEDAATVENAFHVTPLSQMEPNNRCAVVAQLASLLSLVPNRGDGQAALLLEAFLRAPVDQFQAAKPLAEVSIVNRLYLVQQWLKSKAGDPLDAILTCRAVVEAVTKTRDESLRTLSQKAEFIEQSRRIWPNIQSIMLSAAQALRPAQNADATAIELDLMQWSEEVENRLLLEELLLRDGAVETEIDETPIQWSEGHWALDAPWTKLELPAWRSNAIDNWLTQRYGTMSAVQSKGEQTAAPLSSCLDAVETAGGETRIADPSAAPVAETIARASFPLSDLLPTTCVWVRSLFDDDGTLRWWAWRNAGSSLTCLASGISESGARDRLEIANHQFDAAVDRIWAACECDHVLPRELTRAVCDPDWYHDRYLADESALAEFAAVMRDEIAKLAGSLPVTGEAGRELLDWLLRYPSSRERRPTKPWRIWSDRETARRLELNAVSKAHVRALQHELDLSPLYDHNAVELDWSTTDLLFQVQGPLLAMPLSWLEWRGRPIYDLVASTSTSVSLTLAHQANQRCAERMFGDNRIVSAFWEQDIERRKRSVGLPFLHSSLNCIAATHGWQTRSIGDEPRATVPAVVSLVNQGANVVVIGAHGLVHHAGVALADGQRWCGNGADFSSVSLLVLVSCAVGRLVQDKGRDVEGLYGRLATHGASSVVAARWKISDLEAALFMSEFINEYISEVKNWEAKYPFLRARAFNRARRKVLTNGRVTDHLAAAFDIFGLS